MLPRIRTAEAAVALALAAVVHRNSKGQENPKAFMQGIETMITGLVERYKAFNGKGENPFQKESGAAI